MSPTAVNVSSASTTLSFPFECDDSPAGLNYGLIYPRTRSGVVRYDLSRYFSDGDWTSTNSFTGIYETTLDLPQGSDLGTWTFEFFSKTTSGTTGRASQKICHQAASYGLPRASGGRSAALFHDWRQRLELFNAAGEPQVSTTFNRDFPKLGIPILEPTR